MKKRPVQQEVETIRQVFSYLEQFKGKCFVFHINSEICDLPSLPVLIRDLVVLHQLGIYIVLVPGSRTRIDNVLKTYKIPYQTINNIRISSAEAVPFIKMASFDVCNRIMTLLAENQRNGVMGNWVQARAMGVIKGIDYQRTGIVEKIKVDIIRQLMEDDMVPLLANIGWNNVGMPYNVSSKELAFTVARDLGAEKLFFLDSSKGIQARDLQIPEGIYITEEGIINQMDLEECRLFLEMNKNELQQEETLAIAFEACRQGVKRVHIVNGEEDGLVLQEVFSNQGQGTMIYANQHEHIRKMAGVDIPDIMRIMEPAMRSGKLIQRSESDLKNQIEDFIVYDVDGIIHGCGALHFWDKKNGEIAALIIDPDYNQRGIGRKIVDFLIERAFKKGLQKIFILTTQAADWFLQYGFKEGKVEDLPRLKQDHYNRKRNSRIYYYELKN